MQHNEELRILWPQRVVPGSLAVVGTILQVERLLKLEHEANRRVYTVHAMLSDHIPLMGSLSDLIHAGYSCQLAADENPTTLYLHCGGDSAVFFDLAVDSSGALTHVSVEVEAEAPLAAFHGARTAVNMLLDSLLRRGWLSLVIARLDLLDDAGHVLGHQLLMPFPPGMRIGQIGGIHQARVFSEVEGLIREGVCATSPYYRFLCAHRLYDGASHVRASLRKMAGELGIPESLPKDLDVDQKLLEGLGFPEAARSGIRKVNDLHGKMTDLRNQVAHFLLNRAGDQSVLNVSDGRTYLIYSIAGAALLHYGFMTTRLLYEYFQKHLNPHHSRGMILPMKEHRSKFRVVL